MGVAAGVRAAGGLVLASASPQRRALLAQIGIPFTVVEPAYEERPEPGLDAAGLAARHAVGKARSVPGPLVLGVDTVVELDGRVFGKPRDADEAGAMIRALAGRTHTVLSGLCLRAPDGAEHVRVVATDVLFRALADEDVEWYLEDGDWAGRAGAYAIQGRAAAFVREVRGDYTNVVGLPVAALVDVLSALAESDRRDTPPAAGAGHPGC